jgi:hypothetical protein
MKRLQLIDYILIVEGVVLVIFLGIIIARPAPPCIESLDVTRGQNFNQPILTLHNCQSGEVPTNWRDFEPRN